MLEIMFILQVFNKQIKTRVIVKRKDQCEPNKKARKLRAFSYYALCSRITLRLTHQVTQLQKSKQNEPVYVG